jgi:hypothetical protein
METAQLQALWDQLQIQRLLATYCRGIDRCDKEILKSAYWPDATEEHGLFNGNAWEFAEFIVPLLKSMKVTMHQISNTLIELDGDKASAETYVSAYHLMDNPDGGQADMVVGGRYLDRFERRRGEWRIAKRLFVHDWNQNLKASCIWDSGMYAELKVRGSNDRTDPSYRVFGGA